MLATGATRVAVTITLGSGNPHKLKEVSAVLSGLGVRVVALPKNADIPEPHETGLTFAENARQKALYYADIIGGWCLADDSGLVVDAIDGLPGVISARYAADRCAPDAPREVIDRANNEKLLAALASVPEEKRTARFVCHLALAAPGEILLEASGKVEGRIIHTPAGDNGFGYDPLFYVDEKGCTTAQLASDDKNTISHRGCALRSFVKKLRAMLDKTEATA